MFICFDGEHVNPSKLRSSCFLGALQTGTGIFETIRVKENIPEYLSPHLARLKKAARFIGVTLPDADYNSLIRKLLKRNSLSGKLAKLKIIVFPDSDKRRTAHFCMTLEPYAPPTGNNYSIGVKLFTEKHPYCESEIARIKSICRLPYIRLRGKALKGGYFDCLLTDADEKILETTIGNLFIWDGKEFFIPPVSSHRLCGIMERMVIKRLKAGGFRVVEKNIKLRDLNSQKGLLMTNSLIGVMPVRSVWSRKEVSKPVPCRKPALTPVYRANPGRLTILRNVTEEPIVRELMRKFSPLAPLHYSSPFKEENLAPLRHKPLPQSRAILHSHKRT